jgi:hypothetical protein
VSQFAHYETATVYEGQGASVYKGYWRALLAWGGGDPGVARFHPYWDNRRFLTVEGADGDALVSLYHQDGKALVVASNRKRTPVTLRIALETNALGLGPGFKAVDLDPTLSPPSGEDYVPGDIAEGARASRDSLLELDGDSPWGDAGAVPELALEGPEERQIAEDESLLPRLEGAVLVLPVRGRDYRVISLE